LNDELTALRAAFAKLGDGSWNPPVTFVVAQKRHKARLFVENPGKDGDGKLGNVPAGTVVDTTICHATEHGTCWAFPNPNTVYGPSLTTLVIKRKCTTTSSSVYQY